VILMTLEPLLYQKHAVFGVTVPLCGVIFLLRTDAMLHSEEGHSSVHVHGDKGICWCESALGVLLSWVICPEGFCSIFPWKTWGPDRFCLQRARMSSRNTAAVLLSQEGDEVGRCGDGCVFDMKGFGVDSVV